MSTLSRASVWKQMVGRRLTALLTSGLALLGVAQSIREIFEPRVQEQFNLYRLLPKWSAWAWGVLVLAALIVVLAEGAYRTFLELHTAHGSLQEELAAITLPKPKLRFELDHPSCSMDEVDTVKPFEVHRLVVWNTSAVRLEAVRVQIIDIIPMPTRLRGKLPLPLHPMHAADDSPAFDLAPGERRLIDVLEFAYGDEIDLYHAVPHITGAISLGCYRLLIQALVDNAPPAVTTVEIRQGEGNEIWLQFPDES